MDNETDECLHLQWVIYNDKLGIHDLVQIGSIAQQDGRKVAYLDVPYDMVGPFCFETLLQEGEIKFAACRVMSQNLWRKKAKEIRQEIFMRMLQHQKEFAKEARRFNERKRYKPQEDLRKILGLTIKGEITLKQIKSAYKKRAKEIHPDRGGSHEAFCQLQSAYESLMEMYV